MLGDAFLGDVLLGGDPAAESGAPQVHIHGHATAIADLTVIPATAVTIHGAATATGSMGVSKRLSAASHGVAGASGTLTLPPSGLFVTINGVARVGGSLTERRLLIPVLVGIRVVGLSLSATGGVAKANTETPTLDTSLDPSGGLLAKRALHTYFT